MQCGGGGGYGTWGFGKHGLVALGVLGAVGMFDVGRQRHMAVALHQGVGVIAPVVGKHQTEQCSCGVRPAAQQRGTQAVLLAGRTVQRQGGADFGLLADPHVRRHLVAAEYALD